MILGSYIGIYIFEITIRHSKSIEVNIQRALDHVFIIVIEQKVLLDSITPMRLVRYI